MRRRLPWLFLAVTIAVATLAAAQEQTEYVEERKTTCWPCHVAWSPPLVSMYNLILPEEDLVIGEEPVPYPLRIQNPWLADIIYLEPGLDLTQAPSLGFAAQSEPVSRTFEGTIEITPANLTTAHESVELVPVEAGATSLRLEITPGDTIRPATLELAIWPGNRSGDPQFAATAANPGDSVVLELGLEDLREAGSGNWTVVVRTRTLGGPDTVFLGTEVPYTIVQDLRFDVAGERVQYLSSRETIPPEGNARFQWYLVRLGPPTDGERVTVRVNATAFYQHDASSNADDYGNFTKTQEIAVGAQDGDPVLVAPRVVVPDPDVLVGVSMARVSEAVGYASAFALILSVWSGGMFGRASRRQLNVLFGSAKRRVAYHNFLSYALTVLAIAHLVLFLVETFYHWTLGIIWGGIAILAMFGLGVTGALQVPMIRRWNYGTWRWTHLGLAYAALVFTLVHLLLDGANFGAVQEAVGWGNPLDPRGVGVR